MTQDANLSFLTGGGEMGERTRALDWAATPVGAPAQWPQSLKTAVSICLGSRHPIVIWWGNGHYTQFYNDAYIPFLGSAKHPAFLGKCGRECWSEIWTTIGPMLDGVFATGEATWSEDLLLVLDRNLPREETYFTFSYSPIRNDDGSISGIFCACNETTGRVVGERRLRTLRDLSRIETEATSPEGACERAARTLAENTADISFAILYLVDNEGRTARLLAMTGLADDSPAAPPLIDLQDTFAEWPFQRALDRGAGELVEDLSIRFEALPGGPWPESSDAAFVAPIVSPGESGPTGVLVAGLSPRRVIDADYRSFIDLIAGHIGASIANARAYERERERAEALAEIDRAKTAFFSNVSHEFRTPLTLMMGPLEDALARAEGADRDQLELAHRNSLRLLKLVNTLLDFSRIEAGRIESSFAPVDLASLTAELASNFRSAVERAGMTLLIDCPPLSEPVYVDRGMWEKIVLNLISNAFKFTFEGEIEISLRETKSMIDLTVRDTGIGIEAQEIPRLFDRFHRVKGARGRSYEGSGIGLALVEELVRLHGGHVSVESEIGGGSRFIVSIPRGKAHLPADRIEAERALTSTSLRSAAYVEEVLRWLPDASNALPMADGFSSHSLSDVSTEDLRSSETANARILLADDNADMRAYVERILSQCGYDVEVVPEGLAALQAARASKPDLVVSDVMMPGLDGFGLLRELRADPELASTPIILLSARAGEEARIEGMQAGADDYLVKPFSARELLARVESHLRVARVREEATEALRHRTAQFETLLNQAPVGVFLVDADFRLRAVNPTARKAAGDIPGGLIGRDFEEIIHLVWEKIYADKLMGIFRRTLATGEPYFANNRSEFRIDRGVTEHYEWQLHRIVLPDGEFGLVCYFRDIGEQVQAEATRQLLLQELNHRVKNTLASVQAIAQQTARSAKDPEEFAGRFTGRIQSLARVHSLLTDATWRGADLRTLIRNQLLEGAVDETRLTARGPAVQLGPQMAVHLSLMLHELGTNSVKYGALSAPEGRVTVTWSVANNVLRLLWVERGGPPVVAPFSPGFGTWLIEKGARGEGGAAQMLCEAEGVSWDISVPLPQTGEARSLSDHALQPPKQKSGAGSRKQSSDDALAGRRFLVIEDEPLIAVNLVDTLKQAGAVQVQNVGTQSEALRVLEERKFDAVLLDANLHGSPVEEIAAALSRRNVPFAFVTGYGRSALPVAFQDAPIVSKPFTEQQLLAAASSLVRKGGNVVRLNL